MHLESLHPNNFNSFHYAYFVQFDWLKKKFNTFINFMSRNTVMSTKYFEVGIIMNEMSFFVDFINV